MELIFKSEKVTDRITRIFAFNTELMYLVEGSRRAVLIDTGSGFGSLKSCVDRLTDKPVTVLLTHGHTDHALGAAEFDEVYINRADEKAYNIHSDKALRKKAGEMWPELFQLSESEIVPAAEFKSFKAMQPGDVFDLGGISVEIFGCAGHTVGSVVMLIPEERMLLLGDACNYMTFLFDELSTDVYTFKQNLLKLDTETKDRYDTVLLSHGDGLGVPDMIADVLAVCDDILEGRTDDTPFEFLGSRALLAKTIGPDMKRLDGGCGNIVYRKDKCVKIFSGYDKL